MYDKVYCFYTLARPVQPCVAETNNQILNAILTISGQIILLNKFLVITTV